jgi:hypothetical protein
LKLDVAVIGTGLAALTLLGSLYAYDQSLENAEHQEIQQTIATVTAQMIAGDVELDLQRVELELKLLRTLEERRELTSDEEDRKHYLLELRRILREQQTNKVG